MVLCVRSHSNVFTRVNSFTPFNNSMDVFYHYLYSVDGEAEIQTQMPKFMQERRLSGIPEVASHVAACSTFE